MIKIFITGCNKSGTTLLKNLFYAFDDVFIYKGEQSLYRFNQKRASDKHLIAKRNHRSLFSNIISLEEYNDQMRILKRKSIHIVNIIRNGSDVIASNNHVERWITSMDSYEEDKHLISLNIKYEELVTNPDKVQDEIIKKFGFKRAYKFSEYPIFIPSEVIEMESSPSFRAISCDRIKKNDSSKNNLERIIDRYNHHMRKFEL